MKKHLKAKRPITHKGQNYKPGDIFEADEKDAQELIQQGHAEEHTPQGAQKPPDEPQK